MLRRYIAAAVGIIIIAAAGLICSTEAEGENERVSGHTWQLQHTNLDWWQDALNYQQAALASIAEMEAAKKAEADAEAKIKRAE